jgi:acetyl esterase/lipase
MTDAAPIERLKAALARAPNPALLTVEQHRAATEQLAISNPPAPDIVVHEAEAGGVNGAWIETPQSRRQHVIFYIHGGAFIAGSVQSHRSIAGELARHARARVFSVEYRRAPEAPFPAPLDDCLAAYRSVIDSSGIKKLAVAGDSAGGGLALSTIMDARDQGMRQADAAYLISPWADLTCGAASYQDLRDSDPIISRELLQKTAGLYLSGEDPRDKRASPIFGEFHDLPPILIQVGACEVLLNDSREIVRKAVDSGAGATLDVWPDMIHVWHAFTSFLPQATEALQRAGDYLHSSWER